MQNILKIYLWIMFFAYLPFQAAKVSVKDKNKIQLDGDLIFGGLFPMHEKGKSGQNCGTIKKEKGIQRLEAMLFAIDKINADEDILPGLKLGTHILDTCSSDTYALEQCMDFIKAQLTSFDMTDYQCDNGSNPVYTPIKPVVGVIGAAASTVSIMVANILRLFQIPQISYASTSIDLSDKSRFEYFSRVVPPDTFQAQAMVDIAKAFGWNYVSTLADEGDYGVKGIGAFKERSTEAGICVAQSLTILRDDTDSRIEQLVLDLLKNERAKVVVMFANEDNAKRVLKALLKVNKTSELTFLASDSWGAKIHPVKGQEMAAEGAVTLLPTRHVIKEFDKYFTNLTLENNDRNPWFKEFWQEVFNCTLSNGSQTKSCSGNEYIGMEGAPYNQEGLVQFVIDSVYALAIALHTLLTEHCSVPFPNCTTPAVRSGGEVLKYIRNVSFTGVGGDWVQFNREGDGLGKYDIFQYQQTSKSVYNYVKVGHWKDSLHLNETILRWKRKKIPYSVCSEPCPSGFARLEKGLKCCWGCFQCAFNQYLADEYTCKDCPEGSKPSRNQSTCKPLPVLSLEWGSFWMLLPIAFTSIGVVLTILVMAVFIRYNETPVIMASGRELCYVLLIGILMSYGTSVIMLVRPTVILCTLRRLGLGVSLCLIYAAMLTKTNRIYRIFNNGIKAMVKRPSYTSPRSQIFICFGIVSVQIVGGITWLGFEKPDTMFVLQDQDYLVLKCKASQTAIIVSLTYNIVLIIICTVYGVKTRKIPQNFNEAKCIAFTMYSTCIVWLAFIPIYFGASGGDFKIEVTSLCMCVSISATVALVCVFAPKMYIVLLQPHKNVRQGATTSLKNNHPTLSRIISERTDSLAPFPFQNGGVYSQPNQTTQTTHTTINDVFNDDLEDFSCDDDGIGYDEDESHERLNPPMEADI
ncbi:metabotropic glutamate receptor 6-like [Ostrea edulis]|uniref:metabotropic glutamate receptor 6-like n=1 Tax=Ostrea edulis TaxID=37623 RepID=UPI002095A64B|nr:metabotropic glutamate receptor 6-like [Ostrea edulis]